MVLCDFSLKDPKRLPLFDIHKYGQVWASKGKWGQVWASTGRLLNVLASIGKN